MENVKTKLGSFWYRILILLVTLLGGAIVTSLLYVGFLLVRYGSDMSSLQQNMGGNVVNVQVLRVLLVFQSLCIFILPSFLLSRFFLSNPRSFLSLKAWNTRSVFIGMLSILALSPLLNVVIVWNEGLHLPSFMQEIEQWMVAQEEKAKVVTDLMLSGTSTMDFIQNFLIMAVLAGLGEELFFRGLLQRIFQDGFAKTPKLTDNAKKHLTIWIVAFIFSAIHLQFLGFFPRMLLGAWFGYLLWWTGSIWVPVFAHFTNNAIATILSFGTTRQAIAVDPDQLGTGSTWWLALVSAGLMFYISRYFLKQKSH